ncbi:putative bifunctional diguanylate cyclase/phosphodiesterase [Denitratisoma oestradiolicum]|uniref:Putative Diguanylate cyclase n=1 Tax=Denitratisoma oestradiolicum TaxID=311182 RepID=A0A6S6XXG6_9PROT|nr:EAL domain-containing protein [Denitratisoma oestradiolicum]TWO81724.1 hypothetical protein CBW56_03175 [Denitratisoma oestradiolicum]CAB1370674.1 putative Diguanylate cyclase [Denitratisoma oestradiolicum]
MKFLRGLYFRLLMLGAAVAAIAVLSFGYYVAAEQMKMEVTTHERELQLRAAGLAAAANHAVLARDYWEIEQLLRQAISDPSLLEIQISDDKGHVLGNIGRSLIDATPSLIFDTPTITTPNSENNPQMRRRGDLIEVWSPVVLDKTVGWVRLESSQAGSRARHRHIWRDSLIVALSVLVASALMLGWLLRGPVGALGAATRFAASLPLNHGHQLDTHPSITEVDGLIDTLNQTSRQLAEQDEALRKSQRHLEIRNQVYERLALGSELQEILSLIVSGLESERPQWLGAILVLDGDGRHLRLGAAPNMPESYLKMVNGLEVGEGMGSCGTAVYRGERVVIDDIAHHPYGLQFRDLALQIGIVSCWSEPIRSSRGDILGTFSFYQKTPTRPTQEDTEAILHGTHLASVALERHLTEEELQLAASVYQASGEAIMVSDGGNHIVAVNPAFVRLTGYSSQEVMGRSPAILGSGRMDKSFYSAMWQALETSNRWQGEIWNRRKNGEVYAEWLTINVIRDHEGQPHRYIAMFSDITAKKQAEETIWQQANYDQLTGLPNRRLFRDRLRQDLRRAQRQNGALGLMFVDLDRFKEINETLGHEAGDKLLIEAAQRINSSVRDTDSIARLGSDEFAITLLGLVEPNEMERVAQAVLLALSQPFSLDTEVGYVSACIGITLFPNDGLDIETLLKNADQAMHAAKQAGHNNFSWFTLDLQLAAQVRRTLINDLRGALAADQLRVYYQPIIDLQSGAIVKAEALLRWQHGSRGLISPAVFIPLAEEVGLIEEIGDWVFRTAARQARTWHDQGHTLQVSINKSPRQFGGDGSGNTWLAFLKELNLEPRQLVIEITEGLLLDQRSTVTEQLLGYRDAGMEIAVDDFGTGYSALSYLQRFDIDYLKIDRSFIKDLTESADDRALADAIIVMAHKLGLKVIAEGVETAPQRDWLIGAGCDYAQGFLYSRPVPVDEFNALLRRG